MSRISLLIFSLIFSSQLFAQTDTAPAAAPASASAAPAAASASKTEATPAAKPEVAKAGAKPTDPKAKPTSKEAPIGMVIWVKGIVKAEQPKQSPRNLQRRQPIFAKDTITSDKGGTCEIAFTDASVFSMRADTQVKIDEYIHKKGGAAKDEKSVVSLVKGGFRTITGSIAKSNPDGYKVNTPVATIGVRGTWYSTVISVSKGVLFKIDKGSIQITNDAGKLTLEKCASDKKKCSQFGEVKSLKSLPTALSSMPGEFKNDPSINPVSESDLKAIANSDGGGGPGGGSGGPGGGDEGGGFSGGSSGGGFCIQ